MHANRQWNTTQILSLCRENRPKILKIGGFCAVIGGFWSVGNGLRKARVSGNFEEMENNSGLENLPNPGLN